MIDALLPLTQRDTFSPQDMPRLHTWILHDGRIGHLNQCWGLVHALGLKRVEQIDLKPAPYHKLFRTIAARWAWDKPAGPYPDMIIAAGWQASHVARALKREHPHLILIQLMKPSKPLAAYDVVAMPLHDNPPAADNVVSTVGALNIIRPDVLAQEGERWSARLAHVGTPRLAVLIGGQTRGFEFNLQDALTFIDEVITYARQKGYGVLVTTSRRTGEVLETHIRQRLQASDLDYALWTGTQPKQRDNPYLAYLALAETVIVTADSVSMVSEAATAGKPVYVWGQERMRRKKFQEFYQVLQQQKRVAPFGGTLRLRPPAYPLADTETVAGFVRGVLARKAR